MSEACGVAVVIAAAVRTDVAELEADAGSIGSVEIVF